VSAVPAHEAAAEGGRVELGRRRGRVRSGRVDELEPGACWHSEDSLSSPAWSYYGEIWLRCAIRLREERQR
jgi:hypothetical protein